MNYIRIELRQGVALDAFYPRVGGKFDWAPFGTSVQAIKMSINVVTGLREEDGDYIYVLPIVDQTKADACKAHMEQYPVVKSVTFLTEAEASQEKAAIEAFKAAQEAALGGV